MYIHIYMYKGVPRSRIVPRLNVKTKANSFFSSLSLSLFYGIQKSIKTREKGFFFSREKRVINTKHSAERKISTA